MFLNNACQPEVDLIYKPAMQAYFGQVKACSRHLWFYDRGIINWQNRLYKNKDTNTNLVASTHILRETASLPVDVLRSKTPLLELLITNQDKQTMGPWGEHNARAACSKNNLEFKFFVKSCNSQEKTRNTDKNIYTTFLLTDSWFTPSQHIS